MPGSDPQSLARSVFAQGHRFVLAVTGGGSRAISRLLSVPGASEVVLEARVPYSAAALRDWLGSSSDQACNEETARAMAMAAFQRARELTAAADGGDPTTLRGIAATCSLASDRPKRGAHRIHVAWQSAERTAVVSRELEKGRRTRDEEEDLAAAIVLNLVAEACGAAERVPVVADADAEQEVRRERQAEREWTDLLLARRDVVLIDPSRRARGVSPLMRDGAATQPRGTAAGSGGAGETSASETHAADGPPHAKSPAPPAVLFPGSFHPPHEGHHEMARIAAERLGSPAVWELSIANVDKPPLDFISIQERLVQLFGVRILLTRAATFAEKAALAPGATFVVGADTLERIGRQRYYQGDAARRDAAISTIADHGCRFLVFGRATDGQFLRLAELNLPAALRSLCDEVPETEFRTDVSSTELREGDSSSGRNLRC